MCKNPEIIADLFPPEAKTCLMASGADAPAALPEEIAAAAIYAGARRADFLAGRWCARQALQALGVTPEALPREPGTGAPVWPENVLGTISHTQGWAAAAVLKKGRWLGIGLDLENPARMRRPLAQRVLSPAELAWTETHPAAEQGRWQMVFFSAKEAAFKCLHPLLRMPLGFDAVEIRADTEKACLCFTVRPDLSALLPTGALLAGRYGGRDDLVMAGVVLEQQTSGAGL